MAGIILQLYLRSKAYPMLVFLAPCLRSSKLDGLIKLTNLDNAASMPSVQVAYVHVGKVNFIGHLR
ncbi:MAG: hypothetical protein ACYC4E_00550 [Carboxydocellales bacterium]